MKVSICLFVLIIMFSCTSNNKQGNNDSDFATDTFKYEGLTVLFKKDWKLLENIFQDSSKILIWEREGLESSGQLIITIAESPMALDTVLFVMKSNLYANIPVDKSVIKESNIKGFKYLNEDAFEQNYQYEYKGSDIFGRFLIFRKYGKTYILLFQSDESDNEINKKGFEFFENNLKVDSI